MLASVQSTKRQIYYGDGNDGSWWYYSTTAFIIKWVITGVILVGLLVFFLGGYLHAQSRMKKGLPPLRYHRFLVPRKQRERFFPPQGVYYHHAPYGHGHAVPLNTYGPPPPAYGENDYVPPYAPPQGGSKVNPNQGFEQTNFASNPGQNVYSGPSQPPRAAGAYR